MKRRKGVAAEPARTESAAPPAAVRAQLRRPPGIRLVRWGVNLWVVFHFAAVLAAAGSVGPTSDLVLAGWQFFRPYLEALYLNHGYNFFAPEPAPTTLLSYEVERDDGTIIRGRTLDRSVKPRLLYHRYLLLTEHIGVAPREKLHHWYRSYARHLCRKFGGSRVGLTRLTHFPPTMEMVRRGATLDEPFSYEEMFVGDFLCDEL